MWHQKMVSFEISFHLKYIQNICAIFNYHKVPFMNDKIMHANETDAKRSLKRVQFGIP